MSVRRREQRRRNGRRSPAATPAGGAGQRQVDDPPAGSDAKGGKLPAMHGAVAFAMLAITLAGVALRAERLMHPMRYDEAFTYLNFAAPADGSELFNYGVPNNHVLHTVGVWATVQLAGPWPWAIRTPAFLAGCVLIPLTGLLARKLSGSRFAGLLAAALVACSSLMVEYSVNARGYSMLCLAAVGLAILGVQCIEQPRVRWNWISFSAVGALGLLTVPVMLYPIAIVAGLMVFAAMVGRRGSDRRLQLLRIVAATAGAAALGAVLYLPVAAESGWASLVANRFVTPQALDRVVRSLDNVGLRILGDWTRDAGPLMLGLILAGLLLAWGILLRRGRWLSVLPLAACVAFPLASIVQRRVAFPRVWMFAWPWVLAVAGAGLGAGVMRLRLSGRKVQAVVVVAALALFGAGFSAWQTHNREYLISEDSRTATDAQLVAEDLAGLSDGRTVLVWALPAGPPLVYYLMFQPEYRQPFVAVDNPSAGRAAIVVGPGRTLEEVLDGLGPARRRVGRPELHRTYPRSRLYLAPLETEATSR